MRYCPPFDFARMAHKRKVSIFGSARTGPSNREYQQAASSAKKFTPPASCVITGAGPA